MPAAHLHVIRDEESPSYDGRPVVTEHRTMIEDWVVEEIGATLGATALGVYTYLERRVNRNKTCTLSYSRIAEDLALSRRHAIDVIAKLEQGGYVQVMVHKDARANHRANTLTLPHHIVRTPSERPSEPASEEASERPSASGAPQVVTSRSEVDTSRGLAQKTQTSGARKHDPESPSEKILDAFASALGLQSLPTRNTDRQHAAALAEAGITPEDIPAMVGWGRGMWFGKNGFGLNMLAQHVADYRTAKPPEPKKPPTFGDYCKKRYRGWYVGIQPHYDEYMRMLKDGTLPPLEEL